MINRRFKQLLSCSVTIFLISSLMGCGIEITSTDSASPSPNPAPIVNLTPTPEQSSIPSPAPTIASTPSPVPSPSPLIKLRHELSITIKNNEQQAGVVVVNDRQLSCSDDCTFVANENETIKLSARPNEGYIFDGFSGACTGMSECKVTMSAARMVTATFSLLACSNKAPLPEGNFDREYPAHDPEGGLDETLLTEFMVKQSSQEDVENFNVSMVFPLEYGKYFYHGDFHIKNLDGNVIPAQFNVVNRWWAKDRSLRHIQAHFSVDLEAYETGDKDSGLALFKLYHGTKNTSPDNALCVIENDQKIEVDNSLVKIKIEKNPLVISTPAGQLESIFINEFGEQDNSFNHENLSYEIEENGDQRVVIKISSLTNYVSPTEIKHGWAIRLYMHANSAVVNVDFQLQNSALNTEYSAPIYFKSHTLTLSDTGQTTAASLKSENIDQDKISSGEAGFIATPNVNVLFRDFWQRFPQGLKSNENGELSIELYPSWSKQFLESDFTELDLYWLDDMRHTYQELLLDFSKRPISDALIKNFQQPPVVVLPQDYYAKTSVTLELGGFFPITTVPEESNRVREYRSNDFELQYYNSYIFGQDNFGLDVNRKRATNMTGGVPYSYRHFFISGNPKHFYQAQTAARAELNIRPQWLTGYKHDENFESIRPTANPYGGNTWRRFKGHYITTLTREYLEGSNRVAHPRDDQHAWFYHVEQAYLMSANKWIKDWFEFMAEYKIAYLRTLDPWPDKSNRSEGHNVSVAVSAYRVTGHQQLGDILQNYVADTFAPTLLPPHNVSSGNANDETPSVATFQQGYLMRSFIELYHEFPDQEDTLSYIGDSVKWNTDYANYSYYKSILDYEVNTKGNGTGISFVDVAMWYSMITPDFRHAVHAKNYVEFGIGGQGPYGFSKYQPYWFGQYQSQIYYYYLQNEVVTKE